MDKVIGALIKQVCSFSRTGAVAARLTHPGQVQIILSDPKSQDLYELLRREREITSPTTQDLINCRRNTERVLGPDENLFRIDWVGSLYCPPSSVSHVNFSCQNPRQ